MEACSTFEDTSGLVALVHRRWNIPILAELHRRGGAKFVSLANALGISRGILSASLNDLIDLGLVVRNTGHGHPMRPEYLLTEAGKRTGECCAELMQAFRDPADEDLALRKWTLPVLIAIGEEVCRFGDIRSSLEQPTPRAIALALKAMSDRNWLRRTLIDDYPPTAGYALKPKGRRILPIVRRLQQR